jgi:hypothetical protein
MTWNLGKIARTEHTLTFVHGIVNALSGMKKNICCQIIVLLTVFYCTFRGIWNNDDQYIKSTIAFWGKKWYFSSQQMLQVCNNKKKQKK